MEGSGARISGFSWPQRLRLGAIAWAGWIVIRLVHATTRLEPESRRALERFRRRRAPVVLCFWHDNLFSAAYLFRHQDIVVMASRHFDGEYISRIVRLLGNRTARGSSTRGGARALLEMGRCLERGRTVAFTVDGPRGPRHRAKPGPLLLARRSGAPILCFDVAMSRSRSFPTWDRLRVPRLFARLRLRFGEPIRLGPEAGEKEALVRLQSELERLRKGP